jgi:hypothetical protein
MLIITFCYSKYIVIQFSCLQLFFANSYSSFHPKTAIRIYRIQGIYIKKQVRFQGYIQPHEKYNIYVSRPFVGKLVSTIVSIPCFIISFSETLGSSFRLQRLFSCHTTSNVVHSAVLHSLQRAEEHGTSGRHDVQCVSSQFKGRLFHGRILRVGVPLPWDGLAPPLRFFGTSPEKSW